MISQGDIGELGRAHPGVDGDDDRVVRVDAEDAVPRSSLAAASDEVAAELAARLLRFRAR